jgi:hypothetical protein
MKREEVKEKIKKAGLMTKGMPVRSMNPTTFEFHKFEDCVSLFFIDGDVQAREMVMSHEMFRYYLAHVVKWWEHCEAKGSNV